LNFLGIELGCEHGIVSILDVGSHVFDFVHMLENQG